MAYVLVTGAYGGIGSSVVNRLVSSGYKVFALDKKVEPSNNENIIPIECDIESIDSIQNAFNIIKGFTDSLYAIMHFAGIYYLDSFKFCSQGTYIFVFSLFLENFLML